MRSIPLTQGRITFVDDEDFEILIQWNWRAIWNGWNWYAHRQVGRKAVYMHRVIMNAPKGIHVDHANGDSLDNTRRNLRFATNAQNAMNMKVFRSNNTSGAKGVRWEENRRRWLSRITLRGRMINLGRFHYKQDAINAYNAAALKYFGDVARINAYSPTT